VHHPNFGLALRQAFDRHPAVADRLVVQYAVPTARFFDGYVCFFAAHLVGAAASGTDVTYDWGNFSFQQPGFLRRFLTGDTRYWMEAKDANAMVEFYRGLGRPITLQRLALEVYDVIRDKDWASVGGGGGRLWNVDKFYRTMGSVNGGGVGGSMSIAIGAALAHRKHGRLCVRFQPDGDMLYVNSALWTATHHRIPMLFVMQNNRAYHQEVMHLQRMANRRQRGMALAHAGLPGSSITDPNIDFAMMARSMGAYAEGPISNPKDLRPALLRAVERVEKGEVALLDTLTQPR